VIEQKQQEQPDLMHPYSSTNRLAEHLQPFRPQGCHAFTCLIEALTTPIFKVMDSAQVAEMNDGC
jgi:hypothetical protein